MPKIFTEPGKRRYNDWRAEYCHFRLRFMRGNWGLKLLLCIICIAMGIAIGFFMP